jgi:hypothetical protein
MSKPTTRRRTPRHIPRRALGKAAEIAAQLLENTLCDGIDDPDVTRAVADLQDRMHKRARKLLRLPAVT